MSLTRIGIAHDQLPITFWLLAEDLDCFVVNWNDLTEAIDRRTLKIGI